MGQSHSLLVQVSERCGPCASAQLSVRGTWARCGYKLREQVDFNPWETATTEWSPPAVPRANRNLTTIRKSFPGVTMLGRPSAAAVLSAVLSCFCTAHANAVPEGWWGASDAPLIIGERRPTFGESWYIMRQGPAVCALRVNGMDGAVSGIRLYSWISRSRAHDALPRPRLPGAVCRPVQRPGEVWTPRSLSLLRRSFEPCAPARSEGR